MADRRFRLTLGVLVILLGILGTGEAQANSARCNGRAATIVGAGTINGTAGDDVIIGSNGPDRVFGRGGNDTICSFNGNDRIEAGPGADWINGGNGDDVVFGQGDNDLMIGGAGVDDLRGGPGADLVFSQGGNDSVTGGSGNDTIYGDDGNDTLRGGGGLDRIFGGTGNDRVFGDRDNDEIVGGPGVDRLDGGHGNDILRGGANNDTLAGGSGRDLVWGDDGNDTLRGEAGDVLNGGVGTDQCSIGPRQIACERSSGGAAAAPAAPAAPQPAPPAPAPAPPAPAPAPPAPAPAPTAAGSWFRAGMPVPKATERQIWVSPNGNDGANGTKGAPLRSIQTAIDRATPGTTIYLTDGRWDGKGRSGLGWLTFGPEDSGQPGRWVRLTAAPGANPRLVIQQGEAIRVEGSHIEISGLQIEGQNGGPGNPRNATGEHYGYGILVPNNDRFGRTTPAHHIVIADNEVSGFSVSGIATDGANFVVVGGNRVHGNSNWGPEGGSGISFLEHTNAGGGGGGKTTGWITNNLVYNNRQLVNSTKIGINSITDGNCIILDRMDIGSGRGQKVLISENTVHSCGGRGVNVFRSSNTTIEGNLTWRNGITPALSGEMAGDGNNIVWRNNTMVPSPGRQDLIGAGQKINNRVLDTSTSLAEARRQHRSRTGTNVPG